MGIPESKMWYKFIPINLNTSNTLVMGEKYTYACIYIA
jgi:hypothetical protein